MEIRKADEEDIEHIKTIIDRNFDEVVIKYHSPTIVSKFKEHNSIVNLKSQLNWKKVYVAAENEKIVGTGAFADFGTEEIPKYSISNLYVLPELHNKKIGTMLLDILMEDAKKAGAISFHVPSSRNSICFYEKFGFSVDNVQSDKEDEITWMTRFITEED